MDREIPAVAENLLHIARDGPAARRFGRQGVQRCWRGCRVIRRAQAYRPAALAGKTLRRATFPIPLRESERTYCNTVGIGATTQRPRRSPARELRPCLLQAPVRDRERSLQFLREEGNLEFLEQPAELLETRLDARCLAVALDALAIAFPPS